MFENQFEGKIIVFSAPSGPGKTTIVNRLTDRDGRFAFSVSATTRQPRPGEQNGREYYFFSPQTFRKRIEQGAFAEYEEVYEGLFYGTLHSELERIWSEGKHVIIDADVKGGIRLKEVYGERLLAVFIKPPDMQTLEQRLVGRCTESVDELRQRLDKAAYEISFCDCFDEILVNDDLEATVETAGKLTNHFLARPLASV